MIAVGTIVAIGGVVTIVETTGGTTVAGFVTLTIVGVSVTIDGGFFTIAGGFVTIAGGFLTIAGVITGVVVTIDETIAEVIDGVVVTIVVTTGGSTVTIAGGFVTIAGVITGGVVTIDGAIGGTVVANSEIFATIVVTTRGTTVGGFVTIAGLSVSFTGVVEFTGNFAKFSMVFVAVSVRFSRVCEWPSFAGVFVNFASGFVTSVPLTLALIEQFCDESAIEVSLILAGVPVSFGTALVRTNFVEASVIFATVSVSSFCFPISDWNFSSAFCKFCFSITTLL